MKDVYDKEVLSPLFYKGKKTVKREDSEEEEEEEEEGEEDKEITPQNNMGKRKRKPNSKYITTP